MVAPAARPAVAALKAVHQATFQTEADAKHDLEEYQERARRCQAIIDEARATRRETAKAAFALDVTFSNPKTSSVPMGELAGALPRG